MTTLDEQLAECRRRSAKRHKRVRSRVGKKIWAKKSKAEKHAAIKHLHAIRPQRRIKSQ